MSDRKRDIDIWSDVYDLLPSWTWETTADYRLSYIQDNVSQWTGINHEDLLGFMILLDEYDKKAGTNSDSYIATLRAQKPVCCIAYERVLLTGEKVVLVDNAKPRFDARGAFQGYRGISVNLTEILKRADDTESLVMGLRTRAERLEKTLEERNEELQATNSLLSGILEAMGEGLMVTSGTDVRDPDNKILLVNQAYRDLFGLGPDDVKDNMVVAEFAELLEDRGILNRDNGRAQQVNEQLAAGEKVQLEMRPLDRVCYVRANPGPTGGYVLVHTDITELEQKNEALRSARDAAEVASRAKSNFLATMSHEIRTPMNGIVGMAELLAECDLPPEAAEYVQTINNAAMALTQLISEILDFSKIEAGHLSINSEAFDPRALVHEMQDLLTPLAGRKGLSLECVVHDCVPETLEGDPLRLRQILLNLLGNAVKFTSQGYVRLEMKMADTVHIRVRDSGIGIPELDLPRIFHAFQQVENGRERQYEGTGLGLSITKQLVDAMGGRIAVDSTLNVGTVFDLWLPLETGSESRTVSQSVTSKDIELAGLRVLVVEDNRTNQMVVRKLLERRGADVTLASNGQQALETYGPDCFDLLLMDISMPVMTGLEAACHIRSAEHRNGWARTPIVALTGNVQKRDRAEAISAGMDGFLSKPVQKDDLLHAIALHLPRAPVALSRATGDR